MPKKKSQKPPTRRVPSDDCEVTIDGEDYTPHVGEWIEVIPRLSVGEVRLFRSLNALQPKLAAIEGDDGADASGIALMDDSFQEVLAVLRHRVLAWNWTDDADEPYPQPRDAPDVFEQLRIEEIYYLTAAMQGGGANSKNAGRNSRTSSSGSARPQNPA